ncbi:MAG: NADH-quinone oxidoreductase subunit L [Acidobacteria bacterium]|nr:MAG: NADH-quinone oxidoreductase subunit L [Acidobacteriota bacterium]
MLTYLWLIPLAPLAGFLLVGGLGMAGRLREPWVQRLAVAASAASFVLAVAAIVDFAGGLDDERALAAAQPDRYEVSAAGEPARFEITPLRWMPIGDVTLRGWDGQGVRRAAFGVNWTFALDTLTAVMLLVVTGIGTLIHIYSIGYMAGEQGQHRFFAYLNLFMAMMLTLVLAGNLAVLFVGWEGVGLCSYLLIGYYYRQVFDKESGLTCADAGRKAFITNRIGDFGFLLGMLLLLLSFGTWDFSELAAAINGSSAYWYGSVLLTGIGVLLFFGATGKSAQVPLYVWLPDAMAGPTPVSALIHAATMVTAGVYMLARMSALYWHSPGAMFVVAVVGCLTAVLAATMGMAQYDIKKVLAYSTVSQLGYMMLGAGVGAFVAAIFHLVTHAFFKACLFLGSGSVIARCGHTNDMRLYGGLKRWMPTTYWTFLVSTLAIAGLFPLSGFMSKDEILARTLFSFRGSAVLWLFGTLAAVMTSFYMFRAVYMTFHGENRSPDHVREHLRESPPVMTGVLVVLAIGAAGVGLLGVPEGVSRLVGLGNVNWFEHVLHPVVAARGVVAGSAEAHGGEHGAAPAGEAGHGEHAAAQAGASHGEAAPPGGYLVEGMHHPSVAAEAGLFVLAFVVFLTGFLLARWAYGGPEPRAEALAPRLAYLRRLLHRKWFVDELYDRLVIRPYYAVADFFAAVDQRIVDGAVNLSAATAELSGQVLKLFGTGIVRHYALWFMAGAVLIAWMMMR